MVGCRCVHCRVANILKAEGTDLANGVGLLQNTFPALAVIEDVGHVIANA